MITFVQLIELLRDASTNPAKLPVLVPQIQEAIWNSEVSFPNSRVEDVLRDLALDLDYYEPDSRIQTEDPSFFGNERAATEIQSALSLMESEMQRG